MKRVWDVMVGTFMVGTGLLAQAVVIFVIVGLICAAIARHFNVESERWIWVVESVAAVLLNMLIVFEFRRRRRPRRVLGVGGAVFLVPRGFYRIRYGRETYSDAQCDARGFDVVPRKTPFRERTWTRHDPKGTEGDGPRG